MNNTEKIAQALNGISDNPTFEARLFCEKNPSDAAINDFINRRQKGEPLSKIMGEKGFWKGIFKTTPDVLDPRPDSETIIETVLHYIPDKTKSLRILDIGTGSGCLLISLLEEYKNATGLGIDKSKKALAVANTNKLNHLTEFKQVDFTALNWTQNLGCFDVIISNPPYIKTEDIHSLEIGVRKYDPLLALDGGKDGLDAYRILAKTINPLLNSNGFIFFEIGQGQEIQVRDLMEKDGFDFVSEHRDLGNIIRVLVFKKQLDKI